MTTADIAAVARHLYETHGAKAIAEAAQKAVSFEDAGKKEQANFWRLVESAVRELRGPKES